MAEDTTSRGAHRAPRTSRQRRAPRALLGAAALAAAGLLVVGGQGTFAYWTDSATVDSTQFSAGKLDLTVDGQQGTPSYAKTDLTMTGMVPGESVSTSLTVRNVGDADFTWVPTVTKDGGLGPALTVDLVLGATPSADDTTYPRTETCGNGMPLTSGTTTTRLDRAATQTICVKVTLPTSTGDAFQNVSTGSVKIVLAATQVIA